MVQRPRAGAHSRDRILSHFRMKPAPIDWRIPLADTEQGHVFWQPFDDTGRIRSVAHPIRSPAPVPGDDLGLAAAANAVAEGLNDLRDHFRPGPLRAVWTVLGST